MPTSRLPLAVHAGYLLPGCSGSHLFSPASASTLFCPVMLSRSNEFRLASLFPLRALEEETEIEVAVGEGVV